MTRITDTSVYETTDNAFSTSGGYIAMHNGMYYYANPDDNYRLYQMDSNLENKIKLSNLTDITELHFYGNRLYYLCIKESLICGTTCTLYSYDLTRQRNTRVSKKNIYSYAISEDNIYFSTLDSKVYKAHLRGSGLKLLFQDEYHISRFVQVSGNQLYFGMDEGLFRIDLETLSLLAKPIYPCALLMYRQDIYFIYIPGLELRKASINAFETDDTHYDGIKLADDKVRDFTISQETLYYSTEDGKIYKTDLFGNNPEFILYGSRPIVLDDHLFYYSTEGKMECFRE